MYPTQRPQRTYATQGVHVQDAADTPGHLEERSLLIELLLLPGSTKTWLFKCPLGRRRALHCPACLENDSIHSKTPSATKDRECCVRRVQGPEGSGRLHQQSQTHNLYSCIHLEAKKCKIHLQAISAYIYPLQAHWRIQARRRSGDNLMNFT